MNKTQRKLNKARLWEPIGGPLAEAERLDRERLLIESAKRTEILNARERKIRRRESQRKYRNSPKGKAVKARARVLRDEKRAEKREKKYYTWGEPYESEAWLQENPEALAAVQEGLRQTKAGETAPAPDIEADLKEMKE